MQEEPILVENNENFQNSRSKNNKNNQDLFIGKELFHKYVLIKKLGEGSFGQIYSAKEKHSTNYYAIKFENKNRSQNLLEQEANIMSYLKGPQIPLIKSYGYSGDYNVLIMELMGKSLEDLFESLPPKKMSIRCVCNIGYQMVEIIQYIHEKHYIHQDIKPDNFVMGINNKKKYLHILDFGLSRKYRSSTTLKHYPLIQRKNLTGTARYASINALDGFTQSRRDDLEAIGYVLMYFLIGRLPWQGMVNKNKNERYKRILKVKRETTPHQLCQGYPIEFEKYVSYTRKLEYEEEPDYDMLKKLFLNVLSNDGCTFDYYYDWDSDAGTMTTADTNLNFAKNKNINNYNVDKVNNKKNKQILENKEEENVLNNINNNVKENNDNNINENLLEKQEIIGDEVKEDDNNKIKNESNNHNDRKKEDNNKKEEKNNNEEEEDVKNKNQETNINNVGVEELYLSGIIEPGDDGNNIRRNVKKDNDIQCCIII